MNEMRLPDWICLDCGASVYGPRPMWCMRCGHFGLYARAVYSPGLVPHADQDRPVRVTELGAGRLAPSLGRFDELLGRLGRPARINVTGTGGGGKTTLALQLAQEMRSWGAVLYVANDEGVRSQSFKDKVARIEVTHPWVFAGSWTEITRELLRGSWAACVLDSVNNLGVSPADLQFYTDKLGLSWIAVLEYTKGNQFKGDAGWLHFCDAHVECHEMRARTIKNRYAPTGAALDIIEKGDDLEAPLPEASKEVCCDD